MATTPMLKDKVAVVTGAARGIGREIALLMAKHGAKVVVNDYGGGADGDGRASAAPPTTWSTRSRARAARPWPTTTRWPPWRAARRIVQTALDHFGRVDIVVNNAGILRDRMIFNMTEEEWDGVINTHLKGTLRGDPGRGAAHARAEVGAHHQHDVDLGARRQRRPGQLRRGQARHRRASPR